MAATVRCPPFRVFFVAGGSVKMRPMEGGFKKAMDRGVNAAPTRKNERSESPHISTNSDLEAV